jgi:hypothetical protein
MTIVLLSARLNRSDAVYVDHGECTDPTEEILFQGKPGNKRRLAPVWSATAICLRALPSLRRGVGSWGRNSANPEVPGSEKPFGKLPPRTAPWTVVREVGPVPGRYHMADREPLRQGVIFTWRAGHPDKLIGESDVYSRTLVRPHLAKPGRTADGPDHSATTNLHGYFQLACCKRGAP